MYIFVYVCFLYVFCVHEFLYEGVLCVCLSFVFYVRAFMCVGGVFVWRCEGVA